MKMHTPAIQVGVEEHVGPNHERNPPALSVHRAPGYAVIIEPASDEGFVPGVDFEREGRENIHEGATARLRRHGGNEVMDEMTVAHVARATGRRCLL